MIEMNDWIVAAFDLIESSEIVMPLVFDFGS
jgi:hypothetical protein